MNTANQCCCICAKSQSSIGTISNYCSLLFLGLIFVASSMFIQGASAQAPSGTLVLVGPSPDPAPGEEFEVSVEILNPQNVSVFTIFVEYPDVFDYKRFAPAEGQFDISDLEIRQEMDLDGGRIKRELVLGSNYEGTDPVFFSEGTLFTITFGTVETVEIGNYRVELVGTSQLQEAGSMVTVLADSELPSVIVPVRGPMAGTVNLVPPIGDVRVGETTFIDIELKDRSRIRSYEITVEPSANLGALTVSYNADDTNGTAITNHTAGDSITISADLWRPNDPIDDTDWRVTHSDPIVATVFFTPTVETLGTNEDGSFEITNVITVSTDDGTTELTLSNPDPLTFTIDGSSRRNVVHRNTGVGPTPIIEVEDGVKNGPFEILIHFQSENHIVQQHQRLENGEVVEVIATFQFQRGIYGFARDEIEVGGTAGASVTTRLWEADGAQVYYARINPTETGLQTVEISVPAGVVHEVGTNLPNVVSETVTVSTNLEYPPWDVDKNGMIQPHDAELVEEAFGQGMGPLVQCEFDRDAVEQDDTKTGFECGDKVDEHGDPVDEVVIAVNENIYANTIEDPRTDVNGDQYVNQVDVDLVRMHITDAGDPQGRGEPIGQSRDTRQARSVEPPLDASVWMPDENLRRAVREEFGIRDDTELTQARMTHLTSIGFRNNQISDITGLEYAINLTELVFRNTQISNLEPLRGLTSLEDLKLEDSNINDITPLSGLTNLMLLNISGNNISDLTPLGNLTNLTELWATDNNISDVTALASLTQLEKLRLRDNSIFDTSPLYPLTQGALQDVDITISQYPPASTWMPDANLRKAVRKALSLAANENFSQEQVATLTKLTAEKKRISNITGLEHATNLEKLELRRNQIVDVGPLEGLTELTELSIGYNNISDITALENLTQLTHLGLTENEISDISTLGSLTNLKDLWLRDNNISDITALEDLTHLTHLNLEENEISDVTALGSLTKLKELWMWKNSISDLAPLGNLTKLTYLNLKENEISDITALGSLTKLTYLNLKGNEVSNIAALANLTNLKELWMADNEISDVSPLSSLTKLKKLGLVGNPILDTSPLYPLTRRALKNVDITVSQYPPWDVNEDGAVDATDSALVTAALGQTGNAIADPRTDVNGDDTVDQDDLTLVTDNIGTNGGAPSSVNLFTHIDQETLKNLDRETLRTYLNILRAESDGSIKYLRAIAMLEHILAMTRPKRTQLLANYPNPFNPETWIPYQLANASDVKIAIYDATGKIVRRLDLGHQPEGYYTSKVRAAYWDGRNNLGESVASGIYFYHFQADNISSLRKLLILK